VGAGGEARHDFKGEKVQAVAPYRHRQPGQRRLQASLHALRCGRRAPVAHGRQVSRLARLLQLFGGLRGRVVEFSAALSQAKRSAILAAARAGVIGVLVSSDAAARGLDLPSLPCVVQYDVAPRVKAYVHRVGRAARAGRVGLSVSLVRPDQARHFRLLLARTASPRGPAGRAVKEALQGSVVRAYAPRMQAVLTRLQALLEEERAAGGGAAETRPVEALPAKA
jgi:superfamily II DNA/RNA helicase